MNEFFIAKMIGADVYDCLNVRFRSHGVIRFLSDCVRPCLVTAYCSTNQEKSHLFSKPKRRYAMKSEQPTRMPAMLGLTLGLLLLAIIVIGLMMISHFAEAAELAPVTSSGTIIKPVGDPEPRQPATDRTLAPYFITSGDDNKQILPLAGVEAAVDIAGVVAHVHLTQTYQNDSRDPIEAIYVFPMSTRAAVFKMVMFVGERRIEAQIQERAKARADYEAARQQGKTASLLEQQRPNVFQMNVANILPGDEIRVELDYVESLTPDEGIYEFVLPTVVGPRYHNKSAADTPAQDHWVANPYQHESEAPTYTFDARFKLSASIPIARLGSPTHSLRASYLNASAANIELVKDDFNGNRDIILRYSLAGDKVQSGLLLYEDPEDATGYFLLAVEPPERVQTKEIVPRDYVFVVDVSGSMNGFPLTVSKKLLRDLIGGLRPSDSFNVLLFASVGSLFSERSVVANANNIQRAIAFIDRQQGGGGTELIPALDQAMKLPQNEGVSRSIVVVTDGYVSCEAEAFDLIRNNLNTANLFSFGIGSSVNRFLIEGMARAGQSEPAIILNEREAPTVAERFRRMMERPILSDISVSADGFDMLDLEPPSVPDLFAERPILVVGRYSGHARGIITVEGRTASGRFNRSINVGVQNPEPEHEALRYLWARTRIARLGDYVQLSGDDARIAEITDLGLNHHLMTAYTSFVAIDDRVRTDKTGQTILQPLPLPQGVGDAAVGAYAQAPAMRTKSAGYGGMGTLGAGMGGGGRAEQGALSLVDVAEEESAAPKKEDEDRHSPKVVIHTTVESGHLDKAVIKRILDRHHAQIRYPYQRALMVNGTLRGKLLIRLAVDAKGRVTGATVVSDSLKDSALIEQLAKTLKRIVFPAAATGKPSSLLVTIDFKPES
jgi:Ca-activated chloride channel family protein